MPSLNVSRNLSSLRVGSSPSFSEWQSQQRELPQPPILWPLRNRPICSSQTHGGAPNPIAVISNRCLRTWRFHTVRVRAFSSAALLMLSLQGLDKFQFLGEVGPRQPRVVIGLQPQPPTF